MSQPSVKRARPGGEPEEAGAQQEALAQGLPRRAWARVVAGLQPPDVASLRLVCRALHALCWQLEPPAPADPLPARARRLRVLAARASHLTRLSLLLDAADAQGDVDFFVVAVLGARPLRAALPCLAALELALASPEPPAPPLNLSRLACPEHMELLLRHLAPPSKLPPGLARLALCGGALEDAHFARTDLGRHKTLRHVSVEPGAAGRAVAAGPALLRALPPGLHSLRVLSCPRLPAAGPFPKELRELALRGPLFASDSMLAVKALKSLRRLTLDLSDAAVEDAARYAFPTFSMAGFPAGLEALRLTCRTRRVLLAGVVPPKLKLLALHGQIVLSPGMALPPHLLRLEPSAPDALVFKAADYPLDDE